MSKTIDKIESRTVYFTNYPSKHPNAMNKSVKNTEECCRLAAERAKELKIKQIVIASDRGYSALKLMEALDKLDYKDAKVVVDAGMYGELGPNKNAFKAENLKKLEERGVRVVWATSTFAGLSRSLRWRYGTIQIAEIVAAVYKTISEGFKVAVEIAMTCSDTGDLKIGEECIAIGGTSRGADTAVALIPCNSFTFFDGKWGMKVLEIICMPRDRTPKAPSAFDLETHKGKTDWISYSP
jgi:hypothetical protein